MNRITVLMLAAILGSMACSAPPDIRDADDGEVISIRDDGGPDDGPRDDSNTAEDMLRDGNHTDIARDGGIDTAETMDDSFAPDAAEDALDDAQPSDIVSDESGDAADPCPHCPSGICDPETLACLECLHDIDCGMTAWCDNGECRDHLCPPGANFCVGTMRYRCSENGGGFTVLGDCADNDPCTDGDSCEDGRCVAGVLRNCADDNPCTVDYCGVGGACEHYAAEGIVCDDGNPCTRNDHCTEARCVPGGAMDCSDGNPCTFDYCVSMAGCIHEPLSGSCADSNACTSDDRCIEGRCSGDRVDCDDGDPCTADFCSGGFCYYQRLSGCLPCAGAEDCDDGDECTADACHGSGVCMNTLLRTGGCCLDMTDCPPVPACLKPVCTTDHRCLTGALQQAACCTPGLLAEGFDAGIPDGWEIDNGQPDIGWRPGQNGGPIDGISMPAMYFGNADGSSFDNGSAVSGSFMTPRITLPASSASSLSFKLWLDVDRTGGFDEFSVSIMADTAAGVTEAEVWTVPDDFGRRSTRSVNADLSGYAGHTVRIRFSFDSIDEASNDGRGVYVDDVRVDATCSPLACLGDYHCKSAGINGLCRDNRCDFQRAWMQTGSFGVPGTGTGQFLAPTDVAAMAGPEGLGSQILVADSKTHYIQVFDQDGIFVRAFGGYGVTPGRFLTPRGIADSEERIFITDSSGGRIQAMTPAGVYLYGFGSAGIDPGQFDTPRDVAVSNDGDTVYVADTGNHRISVFTRLGVYRYSFGGWGKTEGRFRTPSALAVAPDGRVWVCDTQNNRIQVFSANGVLSAVVQPDGEHAFNYPEGIAAMKDGRMVVADTYNHRLVILDSRGRVVDILGSFGTGPDRFNYPSDVDVMPSTQGERIVVADAGNFRVTIWNLLAW